MIFEQKVIAFEILDIFRVRQKSITVFNGARNFDALSFRIGADTVIKTAHGDTALSSGAITYFPARVDYTRAARHDDLIVIHFHCHNYYADDIEHFYPREPEKYHTLFEEILHLWQQKSPAYQHEASALLYQIFAACFKENQSTAVPRDKIEAAVRYIEENCLSPDFSLAAAAHCSYISESYLRKLFGARFGMSPKQYVLKRRIKHAVALLGTGYYTVREVAHLCGYRDEKYFSVEFKRAMGVSPSKYIYSREAHTVETVLDS